MGGGLYVSVGGQINEDDKADRGEIRSRGPVQKGNTLKYVQVSSPGAEIRGERKRRHHHHPPSCSPPHNEIIR